MKNALVIDRARYDYLLHPPGRILQWLDFLIIEEVDGGATMLKNRYDGVVGLINAEHYNAIKAAYI